MAGSVREKTYGMVSLVLLFFCAFRSAFMRRNSSRSASERFDSFFRTFSKRCFCAMKDEGNMKCIKDYRWLFITFSNCFVAISLSVELSTFGRPVVAVDGVMKTALAVLVSGRYVIGYCVGVFFEGFACCRFS